MIFQTLPISSLTTFQNVGEIQSVCIPKNEKELREFLALKQPFYTLGKGSNTLLSPDTAKIILQIPAAWCPPQLSGLSVHVSAGMTVNKLMTLCYEAGLTGLEFSAGVPASAGGMVAMNFGCWGQEIADVVTGVYAMTLEGKKVWLGKSELEFGYRSSVFHKEKMVITEVVFSLRSEQADVVKKNQRDFISKRIEKQPLKDKTFGSTFKNPEGYFAGEIVEKLSFKGKKVGAVSFSEKHGNFLVNQGQGRFEDAMQLITVVQAQSKLKLGISLETEVQIVR